MWKGKIDIVLTTDNRRSFCNFFRNSAPFLFLHVSTVSRRVGSRKEVMTGVVRERDRIPMTGTDDDTEDVALCL